MGIVNPIDFRDAVLKQRDALSGATFTTRGVENLVNFWTGDMGFGPFLQRLKASV